MADCKNNYVESDRMFVEGDTAWFVDKNENVLYSMNLDTHICKYVIALPESGFGAYRLHPLCIKYEELVFLMPDRGDAILVYNLRNGEFQRIEVSNPDKVRISILHAWQSDGNIWAVASGLKQLVKININEKKIENYFNIQDEYIKELGCEAIKTDNYIYCVSKASNVIWEFNIITEMIEHYVIPDLEKGINTICYDGYVFWLTGYTNKVYRWSREKNEILGFSKLIEINEEQDQAIFYNKPLFYRSFCAGKYVWFVPFSLSEAGIKKIQYVNKQDFTVNFITFSEMDNKENIGAYAMQCVLHDRYIIVEHSKNRGLIEIDADNLQIVNKNMQVEEKDIREYWKYRIQNGTILKEQNAEDLICLIELSKDNILEELKVNCCVGEDIMREVRL